MVTTQVTMQVKEISVTSEELHDSLDVWGGIKEDEDWYICCLVHFFSLWSHMLGP